MLGSAISACAVALLSGLGTVQVHATLVDRAAVAAYALKQTPKSQAGILANIGTSGSKSQGAYSGVVIASPSTVDPNYLYVLVEFPLGSLTDINSLHAVTPGFEILH